MILQLHSYWAYLTIAFLLITVINSILKIAGKKRFQIVDLRIALFTLILSHLQLLIGLAWYFMSPSYKRLKEIGIEKAMEHDTIRLLAIEHPIVMVLSITFITIGFIQHKKKFEDVSMFKTLTFYYGIALLLILSRIPWNQWFQ